MSQIIKKPGDSSVDKAASSRAKGGDRKTSALLMRLRKERARIIIASGIILIILIAVLVGLYMNSARFRTTIIRVDDTSIRMDYFLKRTWLAGADAISMLNVLTSEQVIKLEAAQFGIEVSPEEIDQELRNTFRGGSETISESEFNEWYRQQLNETELSDAEFKEVIRVNLLTTRLNEYLAEREPTVTEQVHLHAIRVTTPEEAIETRVRWEAGEDFADLARELSIDPQAQETGGDLGWLPPGVMNSLFDYVAFDLASGNVSVPIPTASGPTEEGDFYLFMVSEKADARVIDEDALQVLRATALDRWLPKATTLHQISWHGFNKRIDPETNTLVNHFDSETNAWVNWQLSKKQAAEPEPEG